MKESFLIYKSFYPPIADLTDEQLGRLFRAIFLYQTEGMKEVDQEIKIPFLFFINQFRIDERKYEEMCLKNKENAGKRWNKNYATATERMRPDAMDADNDEIMILNEKDVGREIPHPQLFNNSQITIQDIKELIQKTEDLSGADAEYYYNRALDWSQSKGERKKDWLAAIRSWIRLDVKEGKLNGKKTITNDRRNDRKYL